MAEENKVLVRRWLDEVLTQGNLRRADEFSPPATPLFSFVWISKAKSLPVHSTVASPSLTYASAWLYNRCLETSEPAGSG